MDDDRRRFLTLLGAAGVAATAGCSEGQFGAGPGGSEPARYSDFLASESVDEDVTGAFSFDWNGLNELQGTETPGGEETPSESPTPGDGTPGGSTRGDPLAVYPVSALVAVALGVGFAGNLLGLGALVSFEGPTDRLHLVDQGFAFEGEFDTESVGADLTDAGGERVTEHEGVPLYEAGGGGTDVTVAVSEELVVLVVGGDEVSDTTAVARRLLDSEAGRIERYRDAESAFDRLVTQFEPGLIETAAFAPEGDVRESGDEEEEDPTASATQIELEGEIVGISSRATLSDPEYVSELAVLFAAADEVPAETDVEAELGTAATEREVTIDGRLVVVSGTYRETPGDAPLA